MLSDMPELLYDELLDAAAEKEGDEAALLLSAANFVGRMLDRLPCITETLALIGQAEALYEEDADGG